MKLLSILGPTASGKSAVAIEIAHRLNGEIISCDSMQIYRELDIGTAKVSADEQNQVPHHLIDIRDISERFSVAEFIEEADRVIRDCIFRGHQPILCGGTGLYAKALLYGFDFRPRDPDVAKQLRAEFESSGPDALLSELRTRSPEAAEEAGDNPRHWLRALEVLRITGQPPSRQSEFKPPEYVSPEYILTPPAELTRERIRERANTMLNEGWIEETQAIGAERFRASATASQAIGYAFILKYLDGTMKYDELLERITIGTAQFAKRQRTWFRNQHPNARVIPVDASDHANSLADKIMAQESPG